jgi:hypothetical protein
MYQQQSAPRSVLQADNAVNVTAPLTPLTSHHLIRWLLCFSTTFAASNMVAWRWSICEKTKATLIYLFSEIASSNFRKAVVYLSLRNKRAIVASGFFCVR